MFIYQADFMPRSAWLNFLVVFLYLFIVYVYLVKHVSFILYLRTDSLVYKANLVFDKKKYTKMEFETTVGKSHLGSMSEIGETFKVFKAIYIY